MPLDYNGIELKVGDTVRRYKDWCHDSRWKNKTFQIKEFRIRFPKISEIRIDAVGYCEWWSASSFEKVQETSLNCVRVIPAQAEKTEIVAGVLTPYFWVVPCGKNISFLDMHGRTIAIDLTSQILRENAIAFVQLADALDKANKGS